MKLLHVLASYWPATRYGGTIVSPRGLCRALAARGHDVHVYTTSINGPVDSDVPHDTPVPVDGVTVWYFRSPHLRRLYRSPALGAKLRAHIGEFDVVHTHAVYLWPQWAAARAAFDAGIPYVVSPRGMLERDLISQKSPLLKALWIAAVERHNLQRASAIHVTSKREADEARALGLALPQVCEIPNGLTADDDGDHEMSAATRAVIGGTPYILFLGRLSWKKGLDRLLGAIGRLPNVHLVIAGNDEGGYQKALERRAAALDVQPRVTFTGEVHGADKAALLQHAMVLVLPSYSENFGNVVVEAMAEGCPVIVSSEVGLADVVADREAGLVFNGGAESLAAAIEQLLANPSRRKTMGDRGRIVARDEFSWDSVAARMESLYASVVRSARPHA